MSNEDALKAFDGGCMGEHIHEWCDGDSMQQARSGVYGFEFTVEQIETIRKALQAKEPEVVTLKDMSKFFLDNIYTKGVRGAVFYFFRQYPNGIIIKDGE